MEQTNLVVTGDGKTWDEVTRDTSYIGNMVLSLTSTTGDNAVGTVNIFDEARGLTVGQNRFWKDSWVLAYDRLFCLKDGEYLIQHATASKGGDSMQLKKNGTTMVSTNGDGVGERDWQNIVICDQFKRGDYLQMYGGYYGNANQGGFRIWKT